MPKVSNLDLSARRAEIIAGARRCFAEFGYEGATVRRLEQSIGKTRGAIFHHFADKESLFLAVAQEDATSMAEVVTREGLVEVMRDVLEHPEQYQWLPTRLEITRLLRTDAAFRRRWREQQAVLDNAVTARLADNTQLRADVPAEVLRTYLETILDGLISRLASGEDPATLAQMLQMVEASLRAPRPVSN